MTSPGPPGVIARPPNSDLDVHEVHRQAARCTRLPDRSGSTSATATARSAHLVGRPSAGSPTTSPEAAPASRGAGAYGRGTSSGHSCGCERGEGGRRVGGEADGDGGREGDTGD